MAPINPSTDPAKEAYNHGMALDPENKRIQCNYCGKVVPGFNRLQHHLGAITGNVTACLGVPDEVKTYFENRLVSSKVSRLVKEVGDHMFHSAPPSKRACSSNGKAKGMTNEKMPRSQNGKAKPGPSEPVYSISSGSSEKMTCISIGSSSSQSVHSGNRTSNLRSMKFTGCQNGQARDHKPAVGVSSEKEGQNPSAVMAKRCIGRFFFENGIDFTAVTSHSFRSMMEISLKNSEHQQSLPSIAELRGWILDEELNEVRNYVNEIRLSWARTGCSILLDGWTDDMGRSLINIIIDCPEGPVYLRSEDVSRGPDALQHLLEAVLEEVGVHNVVQIIAHDSSDSLEALGKNLTEKYRSLFWTVSPAHCISLMLDKLAKIDKIKPTLDKARIIAKFIYSHDEVLDLVRNYINTHDLVRLSKIKAASSFLTLENFLWERSSLELMLTSSQWVNSTWASTQEGKMVASLISDASFWDGVIVAVKASFPLVKAISLIYEEGGPNMGFIYETMDQVKETIAGEFGGDETRYAPYWEVIDEIWDPILHSPIHAAAYFLNPRFHYAEGFCTDAEVTSGLLLTIVKMVGEQRCQDLITQQLDVFGGCKGEFERGTARDEHLTLSPAAWWSQYGGRCPELQRMAFKILNQTCKGADAYDLKREMAEKLLSPTPPPSSSLSSSSSCRRSFKEQKQLRDLAYIHYNLQLKRYKTGILKFDILNPEADPIEDWIVMDDGPYNLPQTPKPGSSSSNLNKSACRKSSGVARKVQPKGET